MAPTASIPEGYELLAGRNRENAKAALALADERGIDPSLVIVSPALNGYLVPVTSEEADAVESDGTSDEEVVLVGEKLEDLTVAELKEIAERDGIDLGGATRKADIIEAIEASDKTPVAHEGDIEAQKEND